MPYGLKNETPEQTKWMEECVSSIMSKNPKMKESSAIAICKSQLAKESSELGLRTLEHILAQRISDVTSNEYVYVTDVFPEYCIIDLPDGYYKVPYTKTESDVIVDYSNIKKVNRVVEYVEETQPYPATYSAKRITRGSITI